jgi:hypothetical protein
MRIAATVTLCGSLGGAALGCSVSKGGSPGTGGAAGSAGPSDAGGAGGTAGAGGAVGTDGAAGATEDGGSGSGVCISQASSTSPMIPTVGVVVWSTTLDGLTEAHIDFGLTTSYGMTAPVVIPQASYRTLLLGMKPATLYHYRISASNADGQCQSGDYTIKTGVLLNGLPQVAVSPATAPGLSGGFLVTGQYLATPGAGAEAYILDADGDFVWAYNIGTNVTSARMSYDGMYMWINNVNVGTGMSARVHRVSMDGFTDDDLSDTFTGLNHQLTVLPDETVAFYAYNDAAGCDDIKEYSPSSGTVRTVVNSGTALGQTGGCHLNNIQYSPSDDALVFSDRDHDQVAKVRRSDGSTVWILGGTTSTLAGGVTWVGGQHGLHVVDPTRLLIFNNNDPSLGGTGPSSVLEVMIDAAANTASQVWTYTANPPQVNQTLGDVQRMPNGNTMVGFSGKGLLQEVGADGTVLQSWSWPSPTEFGYIEKRATLYGPPPK